jgi:uncharacterized membrane protein
VPGARHSINTMTMRRNDISKVFTWRIISTTTAGIISYLYLGEFRKSVELTLILMVTMTSVHYFFEGWWRRNLEK